MGNVAVVGATWATRTCIDGLRKQGLDPIVYGQKHSEKIAGWVDLDPDVWFDRINDEDLSRFDTVFVVGLSQLVKAETLGGARGIGFHPTRLPKGRGRAPIAWMILGAVEGAATFFELTDEADAGPILCQIPFGIEPNAYAQDVCKQISRAMTIALDAFSGWRAVPQDESEASWLGVRKPEDGRIDWDCPATEIQRLVRATSRPYPGAFDATWRVWRASVVEIPYLGVVGRMVTENVVQCGQGLLRLDEYESL